MHFPLKLLLYMAGTCIALSSLPASWARSVAPPKSSPESSVNAVSFGLTDASDSTSSSSAGAVGVHIKRRRQALCPPEPVDFNELHSPCDMDMPELPKYIDSMPRQCICAYNIRYDNEKEFRVFKTLQLEGFFFGQYAERLKRFEIDPHEFDYGNKS